MTLEASTITATLRKLAVGSLTELLGSHTQALEKPKYGQLTGSDFGTRCFLALVLLQW